MENIKRVVLQYWDAENEDTKQQKNDSIAG
jgi:hypothetical protein